MPSKEELLSSIKPDMKLTKDFFKRIYGYGVTDKTFPDKAIAALESAGCSKARQYYADWVAKFEAAYAAEINPIAHWYRLECEKQWEKKQKEGEERRRIQAEAELLKQKRRLLMRKLQILTSN